MKKSKIIILLLITSNIINAQNLSLDKEYVKSFYKFLFTTSNVTIAEFAKVYSGGDAGSETGLLINTGKVKKENLFQIEREIRAHADIRQSLILSNVKNYKQQLTQGMSYQSMQHIIDAAQINDEGTVFSEFVKLTFPNGNFIYFELNTDTPKQIEYIWLPNGESLGNLVRGDHEIQKLEFPGMINDSDGYTNIRANANKNSLVVRQMRKDEIFYYTPVACYNWWPVYEKEGGKCIGYIYRSKILPYAAFPQKLKEVTKRQRAYYE